MYISVRNELLLITTAVGVGAAVTWLWLTYHTFENSKHDLCCDKAEDHSGCRVVSHIGGSTNDLMRRSIAVAERAVHNGNHPFGAILVQKSTNMVIIEAENTAMTSNDCTRHAELNLVSFACRMSIPMDDVILVTSTEPCAMCATSMYWAGIREIIFGTSESSLNRIVLAVDANGPALPLPCRELFAKGKSWLGEFKVIGPLLEKEANIVHSNFWPEFIAKFSSVHG